MTCGALLAERTIKDRGRELMVCVPCFEADQEEMAA